MEDADMLEQPDEIDEQIDDLDDEVWDRGYKCQTADGVWYEVFVNDTIKSIHPNINTKNEPYDAIFSGYEGLMLDFYDDIPSPPPKLDHLSLSEAGSLLSEPKKTTAKAPDTSHLSVKPNS